MDLVKGRQTFHLRRLGTHLCCHRSSAPAVVVCWAPPGSAPSCHWRSGVETLTSPQTSSGSLTSSWSAGGWQERGTSKGREQGQKDNMQVACLSLFTLQWSTFRVGYSAYEGPAIGISPNSWISPTPLRLLIVVWPHETEAVKNRFKEPTTLKSKQTKANVGWCINFDLKLNKIQVVTMISMIGQGKSPPLQISWSGAASHWRQCYE